MESPTLALAPSLKQLRVTAWSDPIIDRLGHDPRSLYVEKFWLGVLGPTTILLLRHCAAFFEESPDGFDLDFKATASALGLGRKIGRAGPLTRSFERACRFSVVRSLSPTAIEVRRRIPPLNLQQVSRLSPHRRHEHAAFVEGELRLNDEAIKRRARRLALGLGAGPGGMRRRGRRRRTPTGSLAVSPVDSRGRGSLGLGPAPRAARRNSEQFELTLAGQVGVVERFSRRQGGRSDPGG